MVSVKTVFNSFPPTLGVILILVVVVQPQVGSVAEAQQNCSESLGNLNVCAQFVLPGSSPTNSNPSPGCCGAIQAVNHDCFCNTLRIASRLPAQCNLPPLSCPAN